MQGKFYKSFFETFPSKVKYCQDTILETLHPMLEDWSGVSLLGSSVYGVRRYNTGAWLATHLDRLDTHVISVIINVAQAGADWPLVIGDHEGGVHQAMIIYRMAKIKSAESPSQW